MPSCTAAFAAFTETRLNAVLFHTVAQMRELQGVGKELKERKIVDRRPGVSRFGNPRDAQATAGAATDGRGTPS